MAKIRNPFIVISGGKDYIRPRDWLPIPSLDTTKDEIYILNGVINNGINIVFFEISGTGTITWGDGTTATFTNANQQVFSHTYNYANINANTWTTHNKAKQVIIHISGSRNAITYFSTATQYTFTNTDGNAVPYSPLNDGGFNNVFEIKADVDSCEVYCSSDVYYYNGNLEIFDWQGTITNTSMHAMFYQCQMLQSIPQLNTSSVTDMSNMFSFCYNLKNLPQLDTSNVTNMLEMFCFCFSLTTIPQLETGSVTNMQNMFDSCRNLQCIPQLNTSSVTTMYGMFSECSSLRSIPQFNTSNVTNVSYILNMCYSLQNVPQIDCTNLTNTSYMLGDCPSLQKIKLYNLNPTRTASMTIDLSSALSISTTSILELFNSLPTNTSGYSRIIKIDGTVQDYLVDFYVRDTGHAYTAKIPTSDTSIVSGKTYYTYNEITDTYTQVTPDFSTDTFYYELKTTAWHEYEACTDQDIGAEDILTYITNKGYTIA